MQIRITVVQSELKSATSATNKPYKLYEIAYKNHSFQDKLEQVKVNSYSKLFTKVGEMQVGHSFLVDKEKNDGGFWEWQKVTPISPTDVATETAPTETKTVKAAVTKSTYETPEERAKKQVYIIKQSSIGHAIEMLSPGAKTTLKTEEVLVLAQKLANWVCSNDPALAFDDIPDDFPGEVSVS